MHIFVVRISKKPYNKYSWMTNFFIYFWLPRQVLRNAHYSAMLHRYFPD